MPSPSEMVPSSTNTAEGVTNSTILLSSDVVSRALTQTAHAPRRQTANKSAKNDGVPPWAMTT